jgi:cardiolipin synthase
MTRNRVEGKPWVEDRSRQELESVWVQTGAPSHARTPCEGRILQAEESGRLRGVLVNVIEGARDVVIASSFLFADAVLEEALLKAAKRGVRVYLLVSSEARLEREARSDSAFDQKTLDDHKRLLNELAGWVYVRSAEHFHAKFVVADPKTNPRGVLSTANLTKDALARNHELGVWLNPAEVAALYELFSWAFWEAAQRELLAAGSLLPVKAAERVPLPRPSGGIAATAGERRDLRATVLSTIRSATRSLVVASFGLGDGEVIDALIDKARRGAEVTLLVRHPRPALLDALRRLAQANVEVLGAGSYLHAKAILADDQRALVMTANLEAHGLDQGFEVGVALEGEDAKALSRVLGAWRAGAPWRLRASARLGDLRGPVQVMNGKGYKDLVIEPLGSVDDGSVRIDCCSKLAGAERPSPRPAPEGKVYQRIEHAWSIELPELAPKATPVAPPKSDDAPAPPFPMFTEPGGRRVFAIGSLRDIDAAQASMRAFGVGAIVLRG